MHAPKIKRLIQLGLKVKEMTACIEVMDCREVDQ
jgi:hypothetical protein